ncbi:porin [Moraxella canis]|uniref:Porin n=1 Tax=Moraxella canis TaxID=90239 RepID=A0ABZ0WYQ8_9GAMM|nr:porin [Moraxella canis]WQE04331.1 porin [Moraxella canis]
MKKLVLATAVAALSITAAQAAPTVYGKVFLTLDLQDGDTDYTVVTNATGQRATASEDWDGNATRSKLNSNSSRIGFRGSEALTANTDLVYQLEYGVKVDDNSQQFKSRDTYLGLSNKEYGTLLAGRLKAIDGRVDYANVTQGAVMGGDNVLASFDAPRANNAFAYVSPNYNGATFSAMYVMDEYNNVNATLAPSGSTIDRLSDKGHLDKKDLETDVTRDVFGVAAQFEPAGQPYRAGISYIQAGDALKAIRVSGDYQLSAATKVGALYQNTDYDSDKKENAVTISAKHAVNQTPWSVYGQLDLVDNYYGFDNSEKQRFVVGGEYRFNRATTGHIYGAYLNEEVEVNDGVYTANVDTTGYGIGAGIEYRF